MIPSAWSAKLFKLLESAAGGHGVCACVPGCGEDGVDEGILGVLGAHEEHVLCKTT